MKILLIGFLAFIIWSIIATNIYVCKIMGFCADAETIQIAEPTQSESSVADTLNSLLTNEQAIAPKDLTIYFPFDKSDFHSDSMIVKYLLESKNYLNQDSLAMLKITGFTDNVGSTAYNKALGYRRAQSTQYYFESNNVLSQRIVIESYGEKEPADNNNTKEGRANNRRTVITIKN